MHTKILEDATIDQLRHFVTYIIESTKDEDEHAALEMCLYKKVYGYHFSEWMLTKALAGLENEDGTLGPHWSLEQTTSVAKQYDIDFKKFDTYDWCYVMNMIYSDYYGAVPNDISTYVKLAKKFLLDKDSESNKAFKYYVSMNYNEL
jgi:hypothetical protein